MNQPNIYKLAVLAALLAAANRVSAQPECRSVLGAHLKPLTRESILSWSGELVYIPAYMENRFADNTMFFAGIAATSRSKVHQLYFEGGAKVSSVESSGGSSDHVTAVAGEVPKSSEGGGKGKPATSGPGSGTGAGTDGATPGEETTAEAESGGATKYTYGWRELYYQYSGEQVKLRTGLSTTRLGDSFLIDERMLGFNYRQQTAAATFSAVLGSVGEFARMKDFCGTKRLTNLVDKEKYDTGGEDFGDTNVGGVIVTWDLKRAAARSAPAGGDEFRSVGEGGAGGRWLGLEKVGVVAYQELDTRTDLMKSWAGGLARFALPSAANLKLEALYQNGTGPDALIYHAQLEKELYWSNATNTALHVGYFGKYDFNRPARFEAGFTNLFKGEIMRMDAIDVPLLFGGVRHSFGGRMKPYVQLQGVRQLKFERMKELDLELGVDLFKRLRVVAIGSYVKSTVTKQPENYIGKMEMRVGF